MQAVLGRISGALPGLALCIALAAISIFAADTAFVKDTLHLSPLLIVILLGMVVASSLTLPTSMKEGLSLAQRPILRWAVAGLGFKLSFQELVKIGGPALVVVTLSTVFALVFGAWVARQLGLAWKSNALLTVGTSICGASAIVATDSVVQSEEGETAVALGTITLLGTIGILIYPFIGKALGMSDLAYGVWDGASLHEMAQVVAAGHGFSPAAADVATVAKLARICLLAPTVLGLAWWLTKRDRHQHAAQVAPVPWFLIAFVVFVGINSMGWLTKDQVAVLQRGDLWLLTIGMAGVGLHTSLRKLTSAGSKPLMVGLVQWLALAGVSLGLSIWLCR